MTVTDDHIRQVAHLLFADLYEREFRGKSRGRFAITRAQIKQALAVEKLHASTIERLQDEALDLGLVIVDLDDVFACVEIGVLRKYRRPPRTIFEDLFSSGLNPALAELNVTGKTRLKTVRRAMTKEERFEQSWNLLYLRPSKGSICCLKQPVVAGSRVVLHRDRYIR